MNHTFTDSHAHIDMDPFNGERAGVIQRAKDAGVTTILNIGLGPQKERLERAIHLVSEYPGLHLALGIHPHEASAATSETILLLRDLLQRSSARAVGEIGLDYYYEHSPREAQRKVFDQLLDLALDLKLPVTIHSREAFEDTLAAVKDRDIFRSVGGVLHCFTGTPDEAEKFLDLGASLSFSGIVTFQKASGVKAAATLVPLDRLLIETDAPYLAPEPYRGQRNEPAYVVRVAQAIADLKGLTIDEIARSTSANAARLFRFGPE